MALLNISLHYYNKAMLEWSDPRLDDVLFFRYPLSPILTVTFLASYLLVCFKIGPKFMEDREPFNINKIIIAYNILQIILNISGVIKGTPYIIKYNWRCSPVAYEDEDSILIPWAIQYGMLKVFDLLETVFFVARKNYRQITFLHIYHHLTMTFFTWVAIKFFLGGPVVYIVYFNCIVHAVMYCYYLLCIINETHRKSIWWKKHLTQLQIVQFALVFLVFFQQLFRDCSYPKFVIAGVLFNNIVITSLFVTFYYKTYIQKKKHS